MANKKNQEFLELSTDDLQFELESAEAKYQKMKFDHAANPLENPMQLVEVRKDIARIKTELRKRELATYSDEQLANRSKIRKRRRRAKK